MDVLSLIDSVWSDRSSGVQKKEWVYLVGGGGGGREIGRGCEEEEEEEEEGEEEM